MITEGEATGSTDALERGNDRIRDAAKWLVARMSPTAAAAKNVSAH